MQQQTFVTQNEPVQQQQSLMQQQSVQQHVLQSQRLPEDPRQTGQLVQSNGLLQGQQGQQGAQDIKLALTVLHPTAASTDQQASALVSPHLLSLISAQLHACACGCLAVWCSHDATRCLNNMSCLI